MESDERQVIPGYEGYVIEGGEAGVALFHGGMTSPHTMRELAEFLAGRGFTVSVPLLAGHGTCVDDLNRTLWPEVVASARAGIEELEKRGCGKRFIIGHSLGAAVALHEAARAEDVAGVVSVSAPFFLPFKESMLLRIAAPFVHYVPRDFRDISDYEEHRALYDRYDRIPIRFFNMLLREGFKNRELVYSIRCPILVIHGKKDPAVPFRNAEIIHERVRSERKELMLLDEEEHGPLWWAAKEMCYQRIGAFLESLAWPGASENIR
jgi:carboxylesterase